MKSSKKDSEKLGSLNEAIRKVLEEDSHRKNRTFEIDLRRYELREIYYFPFGT